MARSAVDRDGRARAHAPSPRCRAPGPTCDLRTAPTGPQAGLGQAALPPSRAWSAMEPGPGASRQLLFCRPALKKFTPSCGVVGQTVHAAQATALDLRRSSAWASLISAPRRRFTLGRCRSSSTRPRRTRSRSRRSGSSSGCARLAGAAGAGPVDAAAGLAAAAAFREAGGGGLARGGDDVYSIYHDSVCTHDAPGREYALMVLECSCPPTWPASHRASSPSTPASWRTETARS